MEINKIIYWGYESIPDHLRTDEDYAVTQFMVWEEIGYELHFEGCLQNNGGDYPTDDKGQRMCVNNNSSFATTYRAKSNAIINKIKTHSSPPSFNNDTINTINGEQLEVGKTYSLVDTEGVLQDYIPTSIKSDSGAISVKVENNTLKITVNSYTSSPIKITGQKVNNTVLNRTEYIYFNIRAKSQDVMKGWLPDPISFNLTLNIEEPKGNIKVIKYEDDGIENSYTGNLVPNTHFQLSKTTSFEVEDIYRIGTTNENGELIFDELPIGTYYLREVHAPAHLEVDSTIHPITVKEQETKRKIIHYKDPPYILIVYKEDFYKKLILNKIYEI